MSVLPAFEWPMAEAVVERLGWVLVHSLWQFVFVALLAVVMVQALRRRSAATRYGVLVVALALLVAAPVATWMLQPGAARDPSAGPGANALGQAANAATRSGANASPLANPSGRGGASEVGVPLPDRAASDSGPDVPPPTPAGMQPMPLRGAPVLTRRTQIRRASCRWKGAGARGPRDASRPACGRSRAPPRVCRRRRPSPGRARPTGRRALAPA